MQVSPGNSAAKQQAPHPSTAALSAAQEQPGAADSSVKVVEGEQPHQRHGWQQQQQQQQRNQPLRAAESEGVLEAVGVAAADDNDDTYTDQAAAAGTTAIIHGEATERASGVQGSTASMGIRRASGSSLASLVGTDGARRVSGLTRRSVRGGLGVPPAATAHTNATLHQDNGAAGAGAGGGAAALNEAVAHPSDVEGRSAVPKAGNLIEQMGIKAGSSHQRGAAAGGRPDSIQPLKRLKRTCAQHNSSNNTLAAANEQSTVGMDSAVPTPAHHAADAEKDRIANDEAAAAGNQTNCHSPVAAAATAAVPPMSGGRKSRSRAAQLTLPAAQHAANKHDNNDDEDDDMDRVVVADDNNGPTAKAAPAARGLKGSRSRKREPSPFIPGLDLTELQPGVGVVGVPNQQQSALKPAVRASMLTALGLKPAGVKPDVDTAGSTGTGNQVQALAQLGGAVGSGKHHMLEGHESDVVKIDIGAPADQHTAGAGAAGAAAVTNDKYLDDNDDEDDDDVVVVHRTKRQREPGNSRVVHLLDESQEVVVGATTQQQQGEAQQQGKQPQQGRQMRLKQMSAAEGTSTAAMQEEELLQQQEDKQHDEAVGLKAKGGAAKATKQKTQRQKQTQQPTASSAGRSLRSANPKHDSIVTAVHEVDDAVAATAATRSPESSREHQPTTAVATGRLSDAHSPAAGIQTQQAMSALQAMAAAEMLCATADRPAVAAALPYYYATAQEGSSKPTRNSKRQRGGKTSLTSADADGPGEAHASAPPANGAKGVKSRARVTVKDVPCDFAPSTAAGQPTARGSKRKKTVKVTDVPSDKPQPADKTDQELQNANDTDATEVAPTDSSEGQVPANTAGRKQQQRSSHRRRTQGNKGSREQLTPINVQHEQQQEELEHTQQTAKTTTAKAGSKQYRASKDKVKSSSLQETALTKPQNPISQNPPKPQLQQQSQADADDTALQAKAVLSAAASKQTSQRQQQPAFLAAEKPPPATAVAVVTAGGALMPSSVRIALSGMHSDERQQHVASLKKLRVRYMAATHTWEEGTTHVVMPSLKRSDKVGP